MNQCEVPQVPNDGSQTRSRPRHRVCPVTVQNANNTVEFLGSSTALDLPVRLFSTTQTGTHEKQKKPP